MPETEIIDQATFTRLLDSLGGDVGFLNELAEAYFASTPDLFASIEHALAVGDAPALQRFAHSLKTGSTSFGALSFAARCKELEDIGRSGVLDGADEKLAILEEAYSEVTPALRASVQAARNA